MVKPNYGYKKYLQEQVKKKKREEKRKRKLAKKNSGSETDAEQLSEEKNSHLEEENKE